jgi:hypothetical protein
MAAKTTKKTTRTKAAAAKTPVETVAKGAWVKWSGRQHRTLDDQAARYGIPIGGATIALPAVVRWIHIFLAENARRLKGPESGDTESLEYWKTQRERLRYESEIAQRLDRHDVHAGLGRMAAVIRQAGEALQREFPGAEVVLNQALEDFHGEVDRMFGGDGSADNNP